MIDGIYRVRRDGSAVARSPTSAHGRSRPPARRPTSSCRAASSTRWSRSVAASSSPTATTTACCASRATDDFSELLAFGNIVPTGLAAVAPTIFMGEAGPVPHLPQNGKVVEFTPRRPRRSRSLRRAAGRRRGVRPRSPLYALSQGIWDLPVSLRTRARRLGEHGTPHARQRRRQLRRSSRPGPADLGRVLRQDRLRRHAHRQGPEDRRHSGTATSHRCPRPPRRPGSEPSGGGQGALVNARLERLAGEDRDRPEALDEACRR